MNSIDTITILIATHNRGDLLERSLQCLQALNTPSNTSVKIRIVDNASDPPVQRSFEATRFEVELLVESKKGKSHALNLGLQGLTSDLVAFIDDDRMVEPNWLCAAVGYLRVNDCCAIAGCTLVRGESVLPHWFNQRCQELLGATLEGMPEGTPQLGLDGGNMLVMRAVIDKVGGFRTDLGPVGKKVGYSEDSEWSGRVRQYGRLCYCPGAINTHIVEPERIRFSYVMKRQFDYAATETLLDAELPTNQRRWPNSAILPELRRLLGAVLIRKLSITGIDYWLEMSRRAGRLWGLTQRIAFRRRHLPKHVDEQPK